MHFESGSRQKLKGCCESQLSCCFGRTSLQCMCIPPSRESTITRVLYVIIFILGACFSSAMVSRTVTEELLPKVEALNEFCDQLGIGRDCSQLYGYTAVYAVCFAMGTFFLILMLLTIGVKNSSSLRAGIHNGMWFFKLLLLIALVIGYFFVPVSDTVLIVALYIGFSAAGMFILLQLWVLVDLASQWNQKWSERIDNSKWWYCAMVFVVLVFYGVAAGITFLIVTFFHVTGECFHNSVYTSCSVFLCLLLSFFSVMPCFPQAYAKGGFLQASIASAYIMFLTASALLIQPSVPINPKLSDSLVGPPVVVNITSTPIMVTNTMDMTNSSNVQYFDCRPEEFASEPLFNDVTISDLVNGAVSAVVLMVTVIYVCIGTFKKVVRRKSTASLVPDDEEKSTFCGCCRKKAREQLSPEEREQRRRLRKRSWGLIQNEKHEAIYNYAIFHLVFALASFFIMMTLTNWYRPDEASLEDLNRTYPPFTVRLASAWVCGILYLVKLVYLMCCAPNRPNATQNKRRSRAMSNDSDVFYPDERPGPSNISGTVDNRHSIPMESYPAAGYSHPSVQGHPSQSSPASLGNPYPHGQSYPPDQGVWESYTPAQSLQQNYPPAQSPRQSYPPAQSPNQSYPPGQRPNQSYQPAQSPQQGYPSAQHAQSPIQSYPPAQSPRQSYPPDQRPKQNYQPAQSPQQGYPSAQSPIQSYPRTQSPRQSYPPAQSPGGGYPQSPSNPSAAPAPNPAADNLAFYY